jgi:hypothetical protein
VASSGELPDDRAEIDATGLFSVVAIRQYDWERVYAAEEYIALLSSFSSHIAMADWQRERLFGEVRRRLALRPGGTLRRHRGAVLHVARRIDSGGSLMRFAEPGEGIQGWSRSGGSCR